MPGQPEPARSSFSHLFRRYDRMLEPFERVLLERMSLQPGQRVIDVGCGAGTTSLDAAEQVGATGRVIGVDRDESVLQVARSRAEALGLGNVDFASGDAARYPFSKGQADVVVSRFGSLHFEAPIDAYAHLRESLAPAGRLVFVAWQGPAQNPWATRPVETLFALANRTPPAALYTEGPFRHADADLLERTLREAGYRDLHITGVECAACLGSDVDDALEFFFDAESHKLSALLERVGYRRATAALREALSPHATTAGLMMPAGAWLVDAA